jgi:hypothetical protein
MKKLPKKLSACVKLALEDLAKVERSKRYEVHMGYFHEPDTFEFGNDKCVVCFAGAVMAKSLGTSPDRCVVPDSFDDYNQVRLKALDELRSGDVEYALGYMGIRIKNTYVPIPRYDEDRKGFKRGMRKVIKVLEDLGQ